MSGCLTIFMVISLCISGLGNRVSSIIGGMYWAEILNRDFKFVWELDQECMCSFEDIFQFSGDQNMTYKDLKQLYSQASKPVHCGIVNRVGFLSSIRDEWSRENSIPRKLMFLSNLDEGRWFNSYTLSKHTDEIKNNDLVIYHNPRVPKYINRSAVKKILETLKINSDIVRQALDFVRTNSINLSTIGVLIREHFGVDRGKLFNVNEEFYKEYTKQRPDKNFYIMSDNKKYEDMFLHQPNVTVYPKRSYVVWNKNKNHWYRDRESIIDAFTGLLILSRTNIISPIKNKEGFKSSFLELGYYLKDLDL